MYKPQYLPRNSYKAVFFDFGDTLEFKNQSFVADLHKNLMTIDNRLQGVVRICDSGILTGERLKAKIKTDYDAFRLKYHKAVLDLFGHPQASNKYSEYIHRVIHYYHNIFLKPETLQVLSAIKKEGYKLGIVSNFDNSLP